MHTYIYTHIHTGPSPNSPGRCSPSRGSRGTSSSQTGSGSCRRPRRTARPCLAALARRLGPGPVMQIILLMIIIRRRTTLIY